MRNSAYGCLGSFFLWTCRANFALAVRDRIGGDTMSVTSGVVSRIEVTSYVHGSTELLGVQTDAAINAGNSGAGRTTVAARGISLHCLEASLGHPLRLLCSTMRMNSKAARCSSTATLQDVSPCCAEWCLLSA